MEETAMKIQVMSDLHLEFEAFRPVNHGADLLILAGDVAEGGPDVAWMHDVREEFPYVLYIPGNHEYYNNDITIVDAKWLKFAKDHSGFWYKNPGMLKLDGKRILAGCWWTDFWGELYYEQIASQWMNDYRLIDWNGNPFMPKHAKWINGVQNDFFRQMAGRYDNIDLVVTHHGPTTASINTGRHTNRMIDPAYANKKEALVAQIGPKYWIHGHTHHNVNYEVLNDHGFDTKVISNCKGYRNENKEFNPNFIIEI